MTNARPVARVVASAARPVASQGSGSSGYQLLTDWYLIAEGDSITASTSPNPESYARLLPAMYTTGAPAGLSVPAVAGTQMVDMENRWSSVQTTITAQSSREAVVLSTLMSNGLLSLTPEAFYIRQLAYWATARTAGVKIVCCTVTARYNLVDAPGWETDVARTSFNALQRSDPSVYDAIADFGAQSYGSLTSAQDTNLYPDGIHPAASVYALMKVDYKAAIDKLLSSSRPNNTVAPAITGTARVGQTLTCSTGTWSQGSVSGYQWFRLDSLVGYQVPISGATSSTYVVTAEDVDCTLKCNVCCSKDGISVYKATSYTSTVTSYYGPELITNNRFGDGLTTGWTAGGGATLNTLSQQMRVTSSGGFNGRASQTYTTVSGQWYRVLVKFIEGTGGDGKMFIQNTGDSSNLLIKDLPSSASYVFKFQATGSQSYIDLRDPANSSAGSTFLFDNVSIRKITSDPYEGFAAEDFRTSVYTTTSGATVTVGAGDGPNNLSDEYDVVMADASYHYKPASWNNYLNSDVGDTVTVSVWVNGSAGVKVPLRVTSGGGGSSNAYLHTCTGVWEKISVTHTIATNAVALIGFDNRDFVVTGAGGSQSFKVWGLMVE